MARSDVWQETPPFRDDYQLTLVEGAYLINAVKPKQFLHIDQAECILKQLIVAISTSPGSAFFHRCHRLA